MSIVTHVAVYFALHPDAELTGADIGAKWDVNPNNIGKTLRYAEQKGWVTAIKKPNPSRPTKQILFYTAGPRLLKEIGR
jgi:DNA-binding PadR family transcriptional regulator